MADDVPGEELIILLQEAANEFAPVDAELFASAAREELAGFREGRLRDRHVTELEIFRIPKPYAESPEAYLVFTTFAQFFVQPAQIAASAQSLINRLRW